jgi:radical SAM protein with 4Fe4S-binding SPASM domain
MRYVSARRLAEPSAAERVAPPRLVFWETTKACNLTCRHCRAIPQTSCSDQDLTTREGFALIDQLAGLGKPVLVLSGGEPLYRRDVFELAGYGTALGLRMALATNGTLIDAGIAAAIAEAGFQRVAISLDGASPTTHDTFRGVPGAHQRALQAVRMLRDRGVSIQINSSISTHNVAELPRLIELAIGLGADALHVFMLVPVGCGLSIAQSQMLSASDYEQVLHWLYDMSTVVPLELKATCAPHYFRIRAQRIVEERRRGDRTTQFSTARVPVHRSRGSASRADSSAAFHSMTRGCLAGTGVCFVSHVGEIYPCGYLPVRAGSLRETTFDAIWQGARIFQDLRHFKMSRSTCGACRYEGICGGCRARAYSASGDYMAGEPYCAYDPAAC